MTDCPVGEAFQASRTLRSSSGVDGTVKTVPSACQKTTVIANQPAYVVHPRVVSLALRAIHLLAIPPNLRETYVI